MGQVVEYMPTCHSTNDTAKDLIVKSDMVEGTVVITDHQISGRGQRGNTWQSTAGENLTLSIILKPVFLDVAKQFYLNMISSLAIKRAIEKLDPETFVCVKWPNDVLLEKYKVCGILIENMIKKSRLEYSVIGVGLNVNQQVFGFERATSLSKNTGSGFDLQVVFELLLQSLESLYIALRSGKLSEIKQEYLQGLYGFHQLLKYRSEFTFEGEIVDVLDSGILKVNTNQGIKTFDFKEIEFVWN